MDTAKSQNCSDLFVGTNCSIFCVEDYTKIGNNPICVAKNNNTFDFVEIPHCFRKDDNFFKSTIWPIFLYAIMATCLVMAGIIMVSNIKVAVAADEIEEELDFADPQYIDPEIRIDVE
ncbi:hypothetical protein MHBO_004956 [Bonamia ostreae]|uniref:Uncharacterized protein n=1 Tax=Bonamia ostreae TaxID=126728 RepID=A0ABV2AUN6_9EUKA